VWFVAGGVDVVIFPAVAVTVVSREDQFRVEIVLAEFDDEASVRAFFGVSVVRVFVTVTCMGAAAGVCDGRWFRCR